MTVTPVAVSQPKKKMSVGFSSLSWESVMSQSVTSLHRSMKHRARFLCRNPVISTFSKGCIFFLFYSTISKSINVYKSYVDVKVLSQQVFLVYVCFCARALSVDERNKALKQSWRQLEETSALVQMGQSRAAASC